MTVRAALTTALATTVMAFAAAPALAEHHAVQIREVYLGSSASPDAEFVELQLWAAGHNVFTGGGRVVDVQVIEADGSAGNSYVLGSNPPNGGNQRSVLVADAEAVIEFPAVTPDFAMGAATDDFDPAGGGVCFHSNFYNNIDCVGWGTVTGGAPALFGATEMAPTAGSSLERSIAAGCATLLEPADDTNVSATDFGPQATPSPRPNSVAPIETACAPSPGTGGSGGGGTTNPGTTAPAPKKCKKGQKLKKGKCVKKKKRKK